MFSKRCIYAMKIMIYLALQGGVGVKYTGVSQVSEALSSPRAYTAKVLQQLSRAKLLKSIKGPNGGFYLEPGRTVSMADIVMAMDGDSLFTDCILGFEACTDERTCPAHFRLKHLREYRKQELETTHIEEMKEIIRDGRGQIKY